MLESSNDGADKYFSLTVGPIADRHQVVRIGAAEQLQPQGGAILQDRNVEIRGEAALVEGAEHEPVFERGPADVGPLD